MWDLRWVSIYQDLDRKTARDKAFRDVEPAAAADVRKALVEDVAALARDPRAGWALRFYLTWYTSKILQKFDTLQSGTSFHWGFVLHALQALWLFVGSLVVPARIPEWGAVVRLLPTHIRAIGIYMALFTCWGLSNELIMRTTEDQLLSLWIPTTTYMVVNETPHWRYLRDTDGFAWAIVGATCIFVGVVSLRRVILNAGLTLGFRWRHFDDAFIDEITRVHEKTLVSSNKVLNLIDRQQFVPTYWQMIWQPSNLSVNLSIRNSFLKEDIGNLLGGLSLRAKRPVTVASRPSFGQIIRTWLSGGKYPRGPKLFMALLALLVLAFAIAPFYKFEFVMAGAIPWGLRSMLRIGIPAVSPHQSTGDVAKIFAIVVAMGLTDFPFSIALVATNFQIFDSVIARWLLMALVSILVWTISDAIAPFMLHLGQTFGWVEAPQLRLLQEAPSASAEAHELVEQSA